MNLVDLRAEVYKFMVYNNSKFVVDLVVYIEGSSYSLHKGLRQDANADIIIVFAGYNTSTLSYAELSELITSEIDMWIKKNISYNLNKLRQNVFYNIMVSYNLPQKSINYTKENIKPNYRNNI